MERSLHQAGLHTKIHIAHFYIDLTGLEKVKPTLKSKSKLKWQIQTVCFIWI